MKLLLLVHLDGHSTGLKEIDTKTVTTKDTMLAANAVAMWILDAAAFFLYFRLS